MSELVSDVVAEIRTRIFDTDTGRPVKSDADILATIDSSLRRTIAPKLNLGRTYVPNALSFDNTTNTYTLVQPDHLTVPELQMIRQVHTQGRGRDLTIIPYELMMERLNNIIDPSRVKGYPLECTLWPQPDQKVIIKLYPWPNSADVADVMWSPLPLKITAPTQTINLDASGIGALVFDVSSTLIASMNPEKLVAMRVNPLLWQLYDKKRDQCLKDSRVNYNALRPVGETRHAAGRR